MPDLFLRARLKFLRFNLLYYTLKRPRFNLGSGNHYLKRFINVDSESKYNPDIQEDIITFLSGLPKNSVNSFLLLHILPYFNFAQHQQIVMLLAQSTKIGGSIYIEHPDIQKIEKMESDILKLDALFATKNGIATHGNQYRCLMPFNELERLLHSLGFRTERRSPIFHGARHFRDSGLIAHKNA